MQYREKPFISIIDGKLKANKDPYKYGKWGDRTHCKRGHPLTPENVNISKNQRACKTCKHIRYLARKQALQTL